MSKNRILFSKRKNTKKPAVSAIIATVLLIVVAVSLASIFLFWGKGFTRESISNTPNVTLYKESDLSNYLHVNYSENGRSILEYSPPSDSHIKSITVTGYSNLGSDEIYFLDPPINIQKNGIAVFDHNILDKNLNIVIYLDSKQMITKTNIKQSIFSYYTLTVFNTGNGTVSGKNINCGDTCSSSFVSDTVVTLTATPMKGYMFSGWSGACSGTGTCTVTMSEAKSVSANFNILILEFISTWDTTKISSGSSNSNQIKLPLVSNGTYNFTVDWGDGTTNNITTWNSALVTHTYATVGEKTITISGVLIGFSFNNSGDRLKIKNISNWGSLKLGNNTGYFYGAQYLTITATDVLDLTGTTNLTNMFYYCSSITTIPFINNWDVSNVTNMSFMFVGMQNFNEPLNGWDVSNVTNMIYMFYYATIFNQPLNDWNVSKVTNMGDMFNTASNFNQSLNDWNVLNVTNMSSMFAYARNFNKPLNNWNTSNVTNMNNMFDSATNFNQSLANWNFSNVTSMLNMFYNATSFSTANYDALLISLASQSLKSEVSFRTSTKYSSAAASARQSIINNFGWTIYDAGLTS